MGVFCSWVHCVLSFVSTNEILCSLVILVCGGTRSILDLDRFNPFRSQHGSLRWFSTWISGVGQNGGVLFVGSLCPLVRFD